MCLYNNIASRESQVRIAQVRAYFNGKAESEMNANVFYISEEEKQTILRQRLEAERKANRKKLSAYEKTHRLAGTCMLIVAVLALVVFGAEGICYSIMCGLFSIIGFTAKEEDREAWLDL